jgi:hypothetical protein
MQLRASIVIVVAVTTFMMLTFVAAWALTALLGITWLSVICATWAITTIAGVIVLRRLACMLEYRPINLN